MAKVLTRGALCKSTKRTQGALEGPEKAAVATVSYEGDKFDVVVISYDWHPHDHCSFVESASEGKVAMKERCMSRRVSYGPWLWTPVVGFWWGLFRRPLCTTWPRMGRSRLGAHIQGPWYGL